VDNGFVRRAMAQEHIVGEGFAVFMAYTALVLVFHDHKIYSESLAVAHRHNLGKVIFLE
jgi:hypothetical protein